LLLFMGDAAHSCIVSLIVAPCLCYNIIIIT
jgi:hypothetical protein